MHELVAPEYRGDRVRAGHLPGQVEELGIADGHRAAVAARLLACGRPDRRAARALRAIGGQLAAGWSAQVAGAWPGGRVAGRLRSGTATGRRDFAMLTLLATLGLRAGEVAALRLDDISWRAGEITVRGKGSRAEQLPLPADAGEAITAYLRDGPARAVRDRPAGIPAGPRAAPRADQWRGQPGGVLRRAARRDRPGTPAPPAAAHRDLRQGRQPGPASAGPALARRHTMSPLRQALAGYLAVRRSLGYKLTRPENYSPSSSPT